MHQKRLKKGTAAFVILIVLACLILPCDTTFRGQTGNKSTQTITAHAGIHYRPIIDIAPKQAVGYPVLKPDGQVSVAVSGIFTYKVNFLILIAEIISILTLYAGYVVIFCWKKEFPKK